MRRLSVLMLSLTGAVSSASASDRPADATPPNESPCLIARQITSWSQLDDQTVVVRSGSRKFKVTFVGSCRQAKWAEAARVDNFGLCLRPGDVMTFSMWDGHPIGPHWPHWGARSSVNGFNERCLVNSVTLLPPGWQPPPKPAK